MFPTYACATRALLKCMLLSSLLRLLTQADTFVIRYLYPARPITRTIRTHPARPSTITFLASMIDAYVCASIALSLLCLLPQFHVCFVHLLKPDTTAIEARCAPAPSTQLHCAWALHPCGIRSYLLSEHVRARVLRLRVLVRKLIDC